MSGKLLERLKSEEYAVEVGFLLPSRALRHRLLMTREVADLIEALADGAISEDTIRRFVAVLMADLRRGECFPHDLALAALAVVLESRPTDFAGEYLHDLAHLQLAEMGTSIRVARECLKHRGRSLTVNQTRSYSFTAPHQANLEAADYSTAELPRHFNGLQVADYSFSG
jgi:hypothetical protein